MGDDSEFSRGYIKGFKEGLFNAWDELVKLTGRGYTPRELQIMIKSTRSALLQKVERKMAEIEEALGRKIFSREEEIAGVALSDLMPGMSLCFKEERAEKGVEFAKKLREKGAELLSISRIHPDQIRARLNIDGEMIWLTKSELTLNEKNIEFVSPTNLPVLAEAIHEFLEKKGGNVIFIEGLEYLCTQNDFKSVLKFIQLINEQVVIKKGFLILSIKPSTMDPREFSLVERELSQVA